MKLEKRFRHSRGYGVHSPFLYKVVREAMMPRKVATTDTRLRGELVAAGVGGRTATRLQNYLSMVGYTRWAINKAEAFTEGTLFVATPDCPHEVVEQMAEMCGVDGTTMATLCVIHHKGKAERVWRRELVEGHKGMSAEKPRFTFLFFNPALPKQHIII
ncbi:MAG: hypothetical protein IIV29_08305 [Tidjanibacter sp.]|nr:hypothetical protein [Tidjanibacter sp.]